MQPAETLTRYCRRCLKHLPLKDFEIGHVSKTKHNICARCQRRGPTPRRSQARPPSTTRAPNPRDRRLNPKEAQASFDAVTNKALTERGIRLLDLAWTTDEHGSYTQRCYLINDNGTPLLIRDRVEILALAKRRSAKEEAHDAETLAEVAAQLQAALGDVVGSLRAADALALAGFDHGSPRWSSLVTRALHQLGWKHGRYRFDGVRAYVYARGTQLERKTILQIDLGPEGKPHLKV